MYACHHMLLQYHFIVGNWKIIISQSDMEYILKSIICYGSRKGSTMLLIGSNVKKDIQGWGRLEPCKFQKHDFEIKVDLGSLTTIGSKLCQRILISFNPLNDFHQFVNPRISIYSNPPIYRAPIYRVPRYNVPLWVPPISCFIIEHVLNFPRFTVPPIYRAFLLSPEKHGKSGDYCISMKLSGWF